MISILFAKVLINLLLLAVALAQQIRSKQPVYRHFNSVKEIPLCHSSSRLQGRPTEGGTDARLGLGLGLGLELPPEQPRVVVIGDLHGDIEGLIEVMSKAGIIDIDIGIDTTNIAGSNKRSRCMWSKSLSQQNPLLVIQTGDIVDRGKNTLQVSRCLDDLSETSDKKSRSIVRILGNHDIMWLEGIFDFKHKVADTKETILQVVSSFKRNILAGNITGSFSFLHSGKKFLVTHAGLRVKMLDYLQGLLSLKKYRKEDSSYVGDTASMLSSYINEVTRDVVSRCSKPQDRCDGFMSNELYKAGQERGGRSIGGPMWTDFSVIQSEAETLYNLSSLADDNFYLSNVVQIVGHTPEIGRIKTSKLLTSVCVDVGMFMGGRGYLEIEPSGHLVAVELMERSSGRNAAARSNARLRWAYGENNLRFTAKNIGGRGGGGGGVSVKKEWVRTNLWSAVCE